MTDPEMLNLSGWLD
jgi:propanol-preferring alcohol dehydrogenase